MNILHLLQAGLGSLGILDIQHCSFWSPLLHGPWVTQLQPFLQFLCSINPSGGRCRHKRDLREFHTELAGLESAGWCSLEEAKHQDLLPHLPGSCWGFSGVELLTRDPISASCDGSTFSTRSWIETFNSFCTGTGTQNVQAWIKSTSSEGLGYPRGFYSLFQTCSFHFKIPQKNTERGKRERFIALLMMKLILLI